MYEAECEDSILYIPGLGEIKTTIVIRKCVKCCTETIIHVFGLFPNEVLNGTKESTEGGILKQRVAQSQIDP